MEGSSESAAVATGGLSSSTAVVGEEDRSTSVGTRTRTGTGTGQQVESGKRRRSRIPRSCDRCRSSKIKCVFEHGRCGACVSAGLPCTFANPASLIERGPTQNDIDLLHARIESLERLIHDVNTPIDPDHDRAQAPPRFSPPTPPPPPPPPVPIQYIGSNALFSMPNPAPAVPLPSSPELSPIDLIIRAHYRHRATPTPDSDPSPELESHLLSLFLTNIHPQLPILHPPSLANHRAIGLASSDPSFRALSLLIFAIAARFSSHPALHLDLDGRPHPSPQIAGLRFCHLALAHLSRPTATPATLHDLQAFVLLSIYSLGTVSPSTSWSIVGLGLQRAQECGAHREHSQSWTQNPLRDFLRRKAFFALYELDHSLSATLGRRAYMQEEDFDLTPQDTAETVRMGTYSDPFGCLSASAVSVYIEWHRAARAWMVAVGGFRALLPMLHALQTRGGGPGAGLVASVKALVEKIDAGANRWFETLTPVLRDCPPDASKDQILCSVLVTTWYYDFRLLFHRTLFTCKRDAGEPNVHFEVCITSARGLIRQVAKLKPAGLLGRLFYWVPLRLTNAAIVLVCAVRKEVDCGKNGGLGIGGIGAGGKVEEMVNDVWLAVDCLHELAPSTYLAERCEKTLTTLLEPITKDFVSRSSSNGGGGGATTSGSTDEGLASGSGALDGQGDKGQIWLDPMRVSASAFGWTAVPGGGGELGWGVG